MREKNIMTVLKNKERELAVKYKPEIFRNQIVADDQDPLGTIKRVYSAKSQYAIGADKKIL